MPETTDNVNSARQHPYDTRATAGQASLVGVDGSTGGAETPSNTAIMGFLRQLAKDQKTNFADIQKDLSETQRGISAVEEKLVDVLTRITSAEARFDMLENAEKHRRDHPAAPASEVEKLHAKLTEYEDRDRRVNLRIYCFPEHCEKNDAISFLKEKLPEILHLDYPEGLDHERAHQALAHIKLREAVCGALPTVTT